MRTLLSNFLLFLVKLIGAERLDRHDALPLGCSVDDAINLYGEPLDIAQDESLPDSTKYTFSVSWFHACFAWEWRGKIHCIVYLPEKSFPDPDLKFMFDNYGAGQGWNTVTQGYLYFRKDQRVRLWCSAMPPIGVATMEYWSEKESHAKSLESKETDG